jgi:hypothetical protein
MKKKKGHVYSGPRKEIDGVPITSLKNKRRKKELLGEGETGISRVSEHRTQHKDG